MCTSFIIYVILKKIRSISKIFCLIPNQKTITGPRLLSSPRNSGTSRPVVPSNPVDTLSQSKVFEEYDEDDNDDYETDWGEGSLDYLSSSVEAGSRQSVGEESADLEKSRRKKASSLNKLTPVKTPRTLSRTIEQVDDSGGNVSPLAENATERDGSVESPTLRVEISSSKEASESHNAAESSGNLPG